MAACPVAQPACGTLGASLASRLVVAAGGGGGGGGLFATTSATGGSGGPDDADGSVGQDDGLGHGGGAGGSRGTYAAGGTGGAGGVGGGAIPGADGHPGILGAGGAGGDGDIGGGGGGGGGGVYGGGGGGGGTGSTNGGFPPTQVYGSGGGGGACGASSSPLSPQPAGVSEVSLVPTAAAAAPTVTLTWTLPAPTARTGAPSSVTATTATLTGSVNPNAAAVTDCHFTLAPAAAGHSQLPCTSIPPASGTDPVGVSAPVAGLRPATTYTVELVAANAQGQSAGGPHTFTTPPQPTPGPGAPVISALKVPSKLHRHPRRHARAPVISLRLSQASTLQVTFDRFKGRRIVHTPIKLTARARAGLNTITLSGGRFTVGRYRLTVVATGLTGRKSAPQRATFKVIR